MDKTAKRDQATEERILEAAHVVFTRRGTAGARMQEIADEAGVNKALLHYYFRNKEKLASAVFARVAQQIFPVLMETLASDLELEEKVERLVRHYTETLLRSPFLPAYLIGEMNHHPERLRPMMVGALGSDPAALQPQVFARLQSQIDARVAAGTMKRIAPDQLVVNLASLCIFPFAARPMIRLLLAADEQAFRAFIGRRAEELTSFFMGALRP